MQSKRSQRSVKLRRLILLAFLAMISLAGWQQYVRWNFPPYSGLKWRQDQEERVLEAVFRYQIREQRYSEQPCFLSVQQAAPGASLMQRFKADPFVLPLSVRFQSNAHGYVDQNTQLPALYFWADGIEWTSDTEASVSGGGGAAMKSGDAGEFSVHWKHGEWQVIQYERHAAF